MINVLEHLLCEDRLTVLELSSVERRSLWELLIPAFHYIKGALYQKVENDPLKLKYGIFRVDIRFLFMVRVVGKWNRLLTKVDTLSLEVFKTELIWVLSKVISVQAVSAQCSGIGLDIFKVTSNATHSTFLCNFLRASSYLYFIIGHLKKVQYCSYFFLYEVCKLVTGFQ